MEELQCFSPEVCEQIKYYVYRLIDPRNGQTFYVGKGKGNRVFAHVNGALKDFNGENFENKDEDSDSPKIQTIREIEQAGLKVIHLIQCWGLEEKEAFIVESALMDCYSGLTNIQSGHYSDHGVTNAYTLQRELSIETYIEPEDLDYILIKTSYSKIEYCQECNSEKTTEECIYEATRSAWKLSFSKVKNYKYVLGVINGIVKGVYEVDEWKKNEERQRVEFEGHDAPEHIKKYFINKRIPDKYVKKGSANPALYKK